jgi:hypothetical protein
VRSSSKAHRSSTTSGAAARTANWGFNNSEPQIFYSRRIGRSPQLQPDAEFSDPPTATTILGAAKLTGKTAKGWSIGLLEAITSTEKAPTETAFVRGEAVVEPMTNYAVVRLQRDIGRRAGVGMWRRRSIGASPHPLSKRRFR